MAVPNLFLSNLVQTCRNDDFIRFDGNALTFIDRIKDLFQRTPRHTHFETACEKLAEVTWDESFSYADRLEISGRFKQIKDKIKNPEVRAKCQHLINEFDRNAYSNIYHEEIIYQLTSPIFKEILESASIQSKPLLNHSIRKLDVILDHFSNDRDMVVEVIKQWSAFSSDLKQTRSLTWQERIKQFFAQTLDTREEVNQFLREKFFRKDSSTHQEILSYKAAALAMPPLESLDGSHEDVQSTVRVVVQQILHFYKMPMPQHPTYFDENTGVRIAMTPIKDYSYYVRNVEGKEVPARNFHGTMHAARVVLWTQVLKRVYEWQFDRTPVENPYLLAAAGAFHDAAREAEGTDHWDSESATLLETFLRGSGVSQEQITPYVRAIREKDPINNQYTTDIQRIIHDADCLDVMRVRSEFNPQRLAFYVFTEDKSVCNKLIAEAKLWITLTENHGLKNYLEHNSDDFYGDLIRVLFALETTFPEITSFIAEDVRKIRESETTASKEALELVRPILSQLLKKRR